MIGFCMIGMLVVNGFIDYSLDKYKQINFSLSLFYSMILSLAERYPFRILENKSLLSVNKGLAKASKRDYC